MQVNDSHTTRTSAPFQVGQILNPYVTRYRQPFASCAFSIPLPQTVFLTVHLPPLQQTAAVARNELESELVYGGFEAGG